MEEAWHIDRQYTSSSLVLPFSQEALQEGPSFRCYQILIEPLRGFKLAASPLLMSHSSPKALFANMSDSSASQAQAKFTIQPILRLSGEDKLAVDFWVDPEPSITTFSHDETCLEMVRLGQGLLHQRLWKTYSDHVRKWPDDTFSCKFIDSLVKDVVKSCSPEGSIGCKGYSFWTDTWIDPKETDDRIWKMEVTKSGWKYNTASTKHVARRAFNLNDVTFNYDKPSTITLRPEVSFQDGKIHRRYHAITHPDMAKCPTKSEFPHWKAVSDCLLRVWSVLKGPVSHRAELDNEKYFDTEEEINGLNRLAVKAFGLLHQEENPMSDGICNKEEEYKSNGIILTTAVSDQGSASVHAAGKVTRAKWDKVIANFILVDSDVETT